MGANHVEDKAVSQTKPWLSQAAAPSCNHVDVGEASEDADGPIFWSTDLSNWTCKRSDQIAIHYPFRELADKSHSQNLHTFSAALSEWHPYHHTHIATNDAQVNFQHPFGILTCLCGPLVVDPEIFRTTLGLVGEVILSRCTARSRKVILEDSGLSASQ